MGRTGVCSFCLTLEVRLWVLDSKNLRITVTTSYGVPTAYEVLCDNAVLALHVQKALLH